MNLKIETTFDQFVSELAAKALHYGAAHYGHNSFSDLPEEDQELIKQEYEKLDEFCVMTEGEYEQQLTDYSTDYMGEDAKAGDLMWFDGECLCGIDCVEGWEQSDALPDQDKWHDWTDVLDSVKWSVVLREFKRLKVETPTQNLEK